MASLYLMTIRYKSTPFEMWWIILLLLIFVLLWAFLRWIQQRVLFRPTLQYLSLPIEPYESFRVGDVTGWVFVRDPSPLSKWILHCHGNSGNISWLTSMIELTNSQKLNLVVFDYRGFGHSPGTPTPESICADGLAVYHYLTKTREITPDRIVVWGESLGGSVATYVASRRPVSTLVLMATFSSLDDIVYDSYPTWYTRALAFLMRAGINCLPSKNRLPQVTAPVIIVHSTEDEVIPYASAQRMYNLISSPYKRMITITGHHASPHLDMNMLEEVLEFCCIDPSRCYQTQDILTRIRR